MVIIKMPGGDIEVVSPAELLWMRQAFEHEFAGTVMLRLGANRIFSIESLGDLREKFGADGAGLAGFTPPEGDLVSIVNAKNVREAEPANAALHHERAPRCPQVWTAVEPRGPGDCRRSPLNLGGGRRPRTIARGWP